MSESDDHAELNRLVSGEMPDKEALALMRRMLRDSELREAYTRLEAVDSLVRAAYLAERAPEQSGIIDAAAASAAEGGEEEDEPERVSGGADTVSPETGAAAPDERRRQVAAILERIVGRKPFRRHEKIRRRAVGWARGSRALPWTLAASLAVTCSLLYHLFPSGGADRFVQRMDTQQASLYADVRKQLGDTNTAMLWTQDGVSEVGTLAKPIRNARECEVVLRATLICTDQGDSLADRHWSADVLLGRDATVELATKAWPTSVKVRIAPGKDEHIPIKVQARLADSPLLEINNQQLLVVPRELTSVGSVTSGSRRYELFIEAVPVGCPDQ